MSTYDTELDSINNICSITDEILQLTTQINLEVGYNREISNYCDLISAKMKTVQQKAQRMEARMRAYKKSIEDLGFRRVRKKKKHD